MKKKPIRDPDNTVLDNYEKDIDMATSNVKRITSGPEFEAWKKKLMNATFESIPSTKETETIQIPVSIFKKFEKIMHEANIPYSVL